MPRFLSILITAALSCGCVQQVEVLSSLAPAEDMRAEMGALDMDMARDFEEDAGDESLVTQTLWLGLGRAHGCRVEGQDIACWGANESGQLGLGDTAPRSSPELLDVEADWLEVDAGARHTCAREARGRVFCWGDNDLGQLGPLGDDRATRPVDVRLPDVAVSLGAGAATSCAVLADGTLWCWGDNAEGQLAQSFEVASSAEPVRVGVDSGWASVAVGQGHACALRLDGTLWCWGRNERGQLGQGSNLPELVRSPQRVGAARDWVALDVGQDHSCALRSDGTLWCWGANFASQLGLLAGDVFSPRRVAPAILFEQVALLSTSTCAIDVGGDLWCWGRNFEGQLGLGDNQNRSSPTRLERVGGQPWTCAAGGHQFACACAGEVLHCAGSNGDGQLGVGDALMRDVFTPQ